jgi:hypothetical protein
VFALLGAVVFATQSSEAGQSQRSRVIDRTSFVQKLQGSPPCSPSLVRYEQNWDAGRALASLFLPWVASGPADTRLVGHLSSHIGQLADGRINRSNGLVLPAGVPQEIRWAIRGGPRANRLYVIGRRLDGAGSFRARVRIAAGRTFPSQITIPTAGCWQLVLRNGAIRRIVVVRAVEPAPVGTCDASAVQDGRVRLRPTQSGISGQWRKQTADGGALLRGDSRLATGELIMKVPWSSTRTTGPMLHLRGTRLDARGTFRQSFKEAFSPRFFWPSGVIVPEAGCWLLTVRIAGTRGTPSAAGILVARSAGE